MDNYLAVPPTGKPATVKECIISVLSTNWPLTAKRIYHKIKAHGFSVTYQAVFKAISELSGKGVLEKEGREYKLSLEWIEKIEGFSRNLKESYSDRIKGGETFYFASIHQTDMFIIDFLRKMKIGENDVCCSHWRHLWWPLFGSMTGYSELKNIKDRDRIYVICSNNTKIEKWCADFYNKLGMHTKTGIDTPYSYDFIVYGENILQIYMPRPLRKEWDKQYEKMKSVPSMDIKKLFDAVFEKKSRIGVAIIKNKELAAHMKEEVLSEFK